MISLWRKYPLISYVDIIPQLVLPLSTRPRPDAYERSLRRPHAFHLRSELKSDSDRSHCRDLKKCQSHRSIGRVVRREENFPQCEVSVGESDGRVIWSNLDHGCLLVHIDGHGIVLHLRCDAQVAENLPAEDPRLARTVLLTEAC